MSQVPFQKFVPKKKNSLIKEEFKQAKKKAKRERAIAIDKRFEEKRQLKLAERNTAAAAKPGPTTSPQKSGTKPPEIARQNPQNRGVKGNSA